MPLRAAFFDVGDTLIEHWAPRDELRGKMRDRICAALGDPAWAEDLVDADLEPATPTSLALLLASSPGSRLAPEWSRQETERWLREWSRDHGHALDGVDIDRVRTLMCVPLDEVSTPVPGAFGAVRWCAEQDLRVVLVTNTLTRGDAEVLDDWRRFGLADAIHGVVSSHSAGWRKPHPAIFERALRVADAAPSEAFHVGDNLIADVYGAKQLGLRAVWRPRSPAPPDPGRLSERTDAPGSCRHPSDFLGVDGGVVVCAACGGPAEVEIRPDAIVHEMAELPGVVGRWLA